MVRACRRNMTAATGLTLVEVLVVIVTIALLMAMLIPAINQARSASQMAHCKNSLKQIGLALNGYAASLDHLPPGGELDRVSLANYMGWTIAILPFLEHQSLFDQYDVTQPNESPVNRVVQESLVSDYFCPADIYPETLGPRATGPGSNRNWAPGSYRAMTGRAPETGGPVIWYGNFFAEINDTLPWRWRGPLTTVNNPGPLGRNGRNLREVRFSEITDGLSNTIAVGERCLDSGANGPSLYRTAWACSYGQYNKGAAHPNPLLFESDVESCQSRGGGFMCNHGWSSHHRGRVMNFVYCDGHVGSTTPSVDVAVFAAEATIAGQD